MIRLAILFIVWPIIELVVLVQVGRATSAGFAILLVILPALVGAALAKHEGIKTYRRIQAELAVGHIPGDQLIEALLILVAGMLLITPGLISDTLGLLLLVPPLRRIARELLKRRFRAKFTVLHFGQHGSAGPDDDFVDVKAREVDAGQLGRDAQRSTPSKDDRA